MAADRTGLGLLGLIFGCVTVAVMLMAFTTVVQHVGGRIALNAPATITIAKQ
jgi:hypothetical protein